MADMIVSGAGSTALNGTYVEDGTANGKPRYVYGSNSIVWNTSNQWVFNSPFIYYSTDDVATPDLVTTWIKGYMAQYPVPTVTAAGGSAQNLTLSCAAGSYSLAGVACTLTYTPAAQNLTLSCGAGSLALTGTSATLSVKRNFALSCSAGSYAVTGTSASLTKNLVMACETGGAYPNIVVSGAGVSAANGTWVYSGMYNGKPQYTFNDQYLAWSGTLWLIQSYYYSTDDVATPDLVTTWIDNGYGAASLPTVTAAPSITYTLTGSPVTLTVQRNYTLSASAGSYSLTGSDCTLAKTGSFTLTAEAGSYSLTGSSASFEVKRNFTLACAAGSYALTGMNADLLAQFHYSLACNSGAYLLTGSPATINSARTFALGMGSYVLVGMNAGLYILTATPDCRTYFIDAENRTHTIDAENRTMEVRCH